MEAVALVSNFAFARWNVRAPNVTAYENKSQAIVCGLHLYELPVWTPMSVTAPKQNRQLEDRHSCRAGGHEENKGVCALSPEICVAALHSVTNRVFQLRSFCRSEK